MLESSLTITASTSINRLSHRGIWAGVVDVFYAVPIRPAELGSCDGVISDEHARVLGTNGTAIPGLYATGNAVAPIAGPNYVAPGQSLGTSAVFGMIAVRHMLG